MRRSGFTLLELSIVLVIIGLIIGGLTVGSELIRQAELQSVVRDVNKYQTLVSTFKLKYNSMPGDFPKGIDYFYGGTPSTCTNCCRGSAGPTRACNGNGDGRLVNTFTSSSFSETEFQWAWGHLGKAGMMPDVDWGCCNEGTIPANGISGGYVLSFFHPGTLGENVFDAIKPVSYEAGTAGAPALSPVEAYSIDVKTDDGVPTSGKTAAMPNCIKFPYIAPYQYNVQQEDAKCLMGFALVNGYFARRQ